MNFLQINLLGMSILTAGTLVSIAFVLNMWYIYSILLFINFSLWIKSLNNTIFILPFFFSGILLSFAAWFASPWISMILLSSSFGIYQFNEKLVQTFRERVFFLIMIVIIILTGLVISTINRVIPTFFLLFSLFVIIIILSRISEFRLQKKYSGDKE